MVAVVVAAVLLAVAVPSFKSITISNKLNTAVNDLVGSLNTARMEAIKGNASAQFCSNASSSNGSTDPGPKCSTETVGAVVLMTGSAPTVVKAGSPIPAPVIISGTATAIRFSGDGIGHAVGNTAPYTGTVADICATTSTTDNHRIIKMTSGTILETSTSSGACQ
jgi:type IV fimbrial biogenesis protein FimT